MESIYRKSNRLHIAIGGSLFLFLVLLAGAPDENKEEGKASLAIVTKPITPKIEPVDKHLQNVDGMKTILQKSAKAQNALYSPPIDDLLPSDWQVKKQLQFSGQQKDATFQQMVSDLDVKVPTHRFDGDIDSQFTTEVERKKFIEAYDQAYKKAYIRAFLKNARDAGWEIWLNERDEITHVRPIRKEQPLLFSGSTSRGN